MSQDEAVNLGIRSKDSVTLNDVRCSVVERLNKLTITEKFMKIVPKKLNQQLICLQCSQAPNALFFYQSFLEFQEHMENVNKI